MKKTAAALALPLFAAAWFAAMLLPRLATQGLFGDGLLYSTMARNMAEGRGSFWQPIFSAGYWLENIEPTYFENPPLMIFVESLFFHFFGDQWWVEKLFSGLLSLANAGLMIWLWRVSTAFFQKNEPEKTANSTRISHHLSFIILIFWNLEPRVLWGNPNNLMDNFLLTFCLGSLIFLFKKGISQNVVFLAAAAFSIFLGLLAKGPVALFSLAAPVFLAFFFGKKGSIKTAFRDTFWLTVSVVFAFSVLLFGNTSARVFFGKYWSQRLLAVLTGSRSDSSLEGLQKLEIVATLAIEIAPLAAVLAAGFLILKISEKCILQPKWHQKAAFFFFSMGLAGTLPIALSAKQSGIYLLPALPMFAFSAAFLSLAFFEKLAASRFFLEKIRWPLAVFSTLVLIGTVIYSAIIFGEKGREKALLTDLEYLQKVIPKNTVLAASRELNSDFYGHTYLARFSKIELLPIEKMTVEPRFFLAKKMEKETLAPPVGFVEKPLGLQFFRLFEKAN